MNPDAIDGEGEEEHEEALEIARSLHKMVAGWDRNKPALGPIAKFLSIARRLPDAPTMAQSELHRLWWSYAGSRPSIRPSLIIDLQYFAGMHRNRTIHGGHALVSRDDVMIVRAAAWCILRSIADETVPVSDPVRRDRYQLIEKRRANGWPEPCLEMLEFWLDERDAVLESHSNPASN